MRERIYNIVEPNDTSFTPGNIYNIIMTITIIFSVIPLAFKNTNTFFMCIDYVTVSIFITDYVLRLITADFKLKKSIVSFFIYPFTPLAIIDLLSILPSITMLNNGFKLLKLLRLLRTIKVLRALKILRYSRNFEIISNVLKKQKRTLYAVITLAAAYITISALVIFNVEPETFNTFFDAIYWATVSLTTVGYGDIYPISSVGKIITMISSIIGVAIIALPSGVITAGYLEEINHISNQKDSQ